ncbi:sterol desaturase family protein [Brevibacillus agri]|uniref:sterol desaturase family protein n=1 Tax=Brevibacillus TaxID=55080 RepID=UPI003CE49BBF
MPYLPYLKEFFGQRLIIFLLLLCLGNFYGFVATFYGYWSLIAVLSGVVLFIILEYIVHRYILHEFPRLLPAAYQGHVAHHQYPQDIQYLFGPVRYDVIAYLFMFGITYLITGNNLNLAFSVVFGSSLYQLYYQWKHYVSHRPIKPITRWGRYIKKWHLLHHHLDENAYYGVSNSFVDILMGSNKPQNPAVSSPPKKKM